ncbi:MAG: class I SAM-dependent methyltransferase [bacterium]
MNFSSIKYRKDFVKIINHFNYKTGVEVGICQGKNASYILENSNLKVLYGIENWSVKGCRKCKKETEKKMKKYGDRFIWKIGNSMEKVKDFADESVDFIYIDGDHKYQSVKKDFKKWYPKLRKGGLFAAHDYVKTKSCGVVKAADEFFKKINREFHLTEEGSEDVNISLWMIK